MIYKFIDNNDSEITVNSLSSLQALVDSETVKEDTKVKAGLRGKWTTASSIEELTFPQEEVEESVAPEGDIKSFITADENNDELPPEIKQEEVSTQPWQTKKNEDPVDEPVDEPVEEAAVEVNEELEDQYENEKEEDKTEHEVKEKKTTIVQILGGLIIGFAVIDFLASFSGYNLTPFLGSASRFSPIVFGLIGSALLNSNSK